MCTWILLGPIFHLCSKGIVVLCLHTQKVSFTAEMLTYSSQCTGGAYNNKPNGVHTLLRLLGAPVFGKSTVKSYSVHVHAKCMLTVHVYFV